MTTDNRLEARYRRTDMQNPVLLSTSGDVDSLIDALLTGPALHDAVHILSRARSRISAGFPDHELYVGVSRDTNVGALALTAPEVGHVASVGAPGSRSGVAYHVAGHWTEFPDSSEVPVILVREAVKEFLHSGGDIPTCIEWKPFEIADEGVEDDPWGTSS
ncbi:MULTISPECIES: Imm1 family immunity protein [unclassified Streptomyces]|uniref:Imm1 family immunity protein n=1 Tax=unclassified Streptomyces TaxID=2593676 RepID=UPI00338D6F6D